ncbi:hypothetical protein AVEN_50759-1 [Araneus ventricosus]|uniref:MATH domain-containing protein n=1 Tax=Araneus ventricosus TaxID=182803 RepID=A0A4Y2GXY1_ARAVE|nr:hypothetical protein AVEN_50759-1 [Araneus ventricosus]
MNDGRTEYTFFWFIENYSYCWHSRGDMLCSPEFTVDELEGSTWYLALYPRGKYNLHSDYASLYLCRQDDGPEIISLNYQLSVIAVDGSATCSESFNYAFRNANEPVSGKFLKMNEILLRRKSYYLPQDILTVRCKMWKGTGEVHHIGQSSVRSRIGIEKKIFSLRIGKIQHTPSKCKSDNKNPISFEKGKFDFKQSIFY